MCLFNVCKHAMSVYFAHTSGHASVITQCIFQYKADHTNLHYISRWKVCQITVCLFKCFFSIIIICIDYKEWSIHHIFTAKNCLTCSPRFCSSCEFSAEFFRNIIKLLKCICHFYFFFNTVANDLFEIFLEIFADNEYNFVKPCF